jgi:D-aminopeptidase
LACWLPADSATPRASARQPAQRFPSPRRFRACSISKQFVCLLVRQFEQERLIDLDAHPGRYLDALSSFPPTLTVRHLCQNRSGLLDYWCVAMLTGARAESRFTLQQGEELIQSLREPMFSPGAQYSYSNGNWRILSGSSRPSAATRCHIA